MNYLAHLYFADSTDESIVGNLLPDFVRGSTKTITGKYAADIMVGFHRHRFVDAFTDAHAAFITSKKRLDSSLGLMRGVIVDVFYDHLLTRHWSQYASVPLKDFSTRCYDAFERQIDILPKRLAWAAPLWRYHESLSSYGNMESLRFVLMRIANRVYRRTDRRFDLTPALETLENERAAFNDDFNRFFPALIDTVRKAVRKDANVTPTTTCEPYGLWACETSPGPTT